jgi:bifunctional non-homologous end joining protein LigD
MLDRTTPIAAARRRRDLALPTGFIPPCLPMMAPRPPAGALWLHEIKHDGIRIVARNDGRGITLYGRSADDLTYRFPLIVAAMERLPPCTLDGEAVICNDDGLAAFELLGRGPRDEHAFLLTFDLIELRRDDRRRDPLEQRKADLGRLLAHAGPGLMLNEWIDGGESDGAPLFERACALGLEGIVSKRRDSRYISGRSPYWLKMENPASAAARRTELVPAETPDEPDREPQ